MSTVRADRTRSIWTTDEEIAEAARRTAAEQPSMCLGTTAKIAAVIPAGPQDCESEGKPGTRSLTRPAPACGGLSTREECTALAQAITIRARVRLALAYESLYDSWATEDQIKRAEPKGPQRAAQPASGSGSPPASPRTAGQPPANSPAGRRGVPARRKSWPYLLRLIRPRVPIAGGPGGHTRQGAGTGTRGDQAE
jgi:hypothetical protein